eukprot:gene5269-18506_t
MDFISFSSSNGLQVSSAIGSGQAGSATNLSAPGQPLDNQLLQLRREQQQAELRRLIAASDANANATSGGHQAHMQAHPPGHPGGWGDAQTLGALNWVQAQNKPNQQYVLALQQHQSQPLQQYALSALPQQNHNSQPFTLSMGHQGTQAFNLQQPSSHGSSIEELNKYLQRPYGGSSNGAPSNEIERMYMDAQAQPGGHGAPLAWPMGTSAMNPGMMGQHSDSLIKVGHTDNPTLCHTPVMGNDMSHLSSDEPGANKSGMLTDTPLGHKEQGGSASEKNKLAQRRFRQRQKDRTHLLEKELDQLKEKVASMQRHQLTLEKALGEKMSKSGEGNVVVAKVENMEQDTPVDPIQATKLSTSTKGAEIGSMSAESARITWVTKFQELVRHIGPADLFLKDERSPEDTAQALSLAKELLLFAQNCAVSSPLAFKHLHCTRLDTGEQMTGRHDCVMVEDKAKLGLIPANRWHLQLSEKQRSDMSASRKQFLAKMQLTFEERRRILTTLPGMIEAPKMESHSLAVGGVMGMAGMDQLKANMEKEHTIWADAHLYLSQLVLTPKQYAVLCAASYPIFYDPLALAGIVSAAETSTV